MMSKAVVAVLGPTASGKSALAVALAERFNGEVVACDSTAVYRGFDIGTDKVSPAEQRGIRAPRPVVAGGTGLYYRALTRGLFPGAGRDVVLRARLDRMAARFGAG